MLKSQSAIEVSFRIIDVFVRVREMVIDNTEVRLEIEKIKHIINSQSKNMEVVFQYLDELQGKVDKLSPKLSSNEQQIGFKLGE